MPLPEGWFGQLALVAYLLKISNKQISSLGESCVVLVRCWTSSSCFCYRYLRPTSGIYGIPRPLCLIYIYFQVLVVQLLFFTSSSSEVYRSNNLSIGLGMFFPPKICFFWSFIYGRLAFKKPTFLFFFLQQNSCQCPICPFLFGLDVDLSVMGIWKVLNTGLWQIPTSLGHPQSPFITPTLESITEPAKVLVSESDRQLFMCEVRW